MARGETISKKSKPSAERAKYRRRPLPVPTHIFSVPSFCAAFGISQAFFFKLQSEGRGPRLTRIGSRVFISHTAADDWCRAREAETAAAATTAAE
jgi:predicted DNA-binding transcriptional regulator AlpA